MLGRLSFAILASQFYVTSANAQWTSSAQVGFSVDSIATQSSQQGSHTSLHLLRTITKDVSAGMRTALYGGSGGETEYFRAAVGPALLWKVTSSWSILGAAAKTKERRGYTGDSEQDNYSGDLATLAWQREFHPIRRSSFTVTWGGFFNIHNAEISGQSSNLQAVHQISGTSRGLELGIVFPM